MLLRIIAVHESSANSAGVSPSPQSVRVAFGAGRRTGLAAGVQLWGISMVTVTLHIIYKPLHSCK